VTVRASANPARKARSSCRGEVGLVLAGNVVTSEGQPGDPLSAMAAAKLQNLPTSPPSLGRSVTVRASANPARKARSSCRGEVGAVLAGNVVTSKGAAAGPLERHDGPKTSKLAYVPSLSPLLYAPFLPEKGIVLEPLVH